jgi:E3 ubiquitin-protein ligase SHPRH
MVGLPNQKISTAAEKFIDTIEKNILDLAARKGLSIYTKDNSAGTLNVTNFTLTSKDSSVDSTTKSKKGQKGDFIFK